MIRFFFAFSRNSMQQQAASSEPVYVISVAARLAELPCWVLRVLDQEGVVVPVRTDSNRRLYSDQDIVVLARVRHWTEIRGVNINGVKVILEIEKAHAEALQAQARANADAPESGRGENAPQAAIASGAVRLALPAPHARCGPRAFLTACRRPAARPKIR